MYFLYEIIFMGIGDWGLGIGDWGLGIGFTFCTLKETATGIDEVKSQKPETKTGVYTLDGRRVNAENLRPGLYIMNGKKVVIK